MAMFWAMAAGLLGASALILLRALRRARGGAAFGAAAADARVYAAQLDEIARDVERGTLTEAEAAGLRAEVARRLLAAGRGAEDAAAPAASGPGPAAALLAVLALLGGAALYLWLGVPGLSDLPRAARIAATETARAARPAQAEAEAAVPAWVPPADMPAETAALIARLREVVAARPDDAEGHALLARTEAQIGNFAAARAAQARLVVLKGAAATAPDFAALARYAVAAAAGQVTAEAEAAALSALRLDPDDSLALFLAGVGEVQVGRADRAFAAWARLVATAPAGDPWRAEALRAMPALAAAAGQRWELPPEPPAPGPSLTDEALQGAAALAPDERSAMIRGMVEALAARLAEAGGPAADWARLIQSLGVLGETDRARAIWAEAQGRFAGRAEDLALVRAAAVAAGVAE
jgi:cytochrome c-type biogenesis protein CcmH